MTALGKLLENLKAQAKTWLKAYYTLLGLLLLINIFLRPEHPHFGLDVYVGFWAIFGFGVGVPMIFIMKRLIQPLIVRSEDYYGDI